MRSVLFLKRAVATALTLSGLGCSGNFFALDNGDSRPMQVKGVEPLGAAESAHLKQLGFVISPEAKVASFHWGYTGLFKNHEPVYFTADAVLHAVHRSYDHILRDLEEQALYDKLGALIDALRAELTKSSEGTPEVRRDLDIYLGVAKSLHAGGDAAPVAGADKAQIASLAKAGVEASGMADIDWFGEPMHMDFSMMKPRGHYTSSVKLQRYFRSYMWLARTEIRMAKVTPEKVAVNRKALAGAFVLRALFDAKAEAAWKALDDMTRVFVGPSDSMSFTGLGAAWEKAGKPSVAEVGSWTESRVSEVFANATQQKIRSQLQHRDEKSIAFLMLGQRYVADSEVLSRVTYGELPQKRMMPSPLDVGWGILDNNSAKTLLAPELQAYKYDTELEAARNNAKSLGPDVWQSNLYHIWLDALTKLSPNEARDKGLPKVMLTDAWSRRMLNAQLASWAELRHDNLLYAKQSFTAMALCAYPDAYVDPYPEAFDAIVRFARKGMEAVEAIPELKQTKGLQVMAYFKRLGDIATTLSIIAMRERNGESLAPEDLDFFNHAVSVDGKSAGCTTVYEAGGWYADLYYDKDEVLWHKTVVADVHTQPTDEDGNTVGRILHVGTERPQGIAVTIDSCNGPTTYRGFVSSYRETITSNFKRMTDEEWQSQKAEDHPPPTWMTPLSPQ